GSRHLGEKPGTAKSVLHRVRPCAPRKSEPRCRSIPSTLADVPRPCRWRAGHSSFGRTEFQSSCIPLGQSYLFSRNKLWESYASEEVVQSIQASETTLRASAALAPSECFPSLLRRAASDSSPGHRAGSNQTSETSRR